MKRLLISVVFIIILIGAAFSQEEGISFSFGMPFSVQYNLQSENISLWNLRYGLGFDFFLKLDPSMYLGIELDAQTGFMKNNITDENFQEFYIDFPMRIVYLWKLPVIIFEGYAGVIYQGAAVLDDGMLYAEAFKFTLNYEAGVRLGLGDLSFFFVDIGYVIAEHGYLHLGLGVRLGLF